jgi:hypothetical protein
LNSSLSTLLKSACRLYAAIDAKAQAEIAAQFAAFLDI